MIPHTHPNVVTHIADARAHMQHVAEARIERSIVRMQERLCAWMRGYPICELEEAQVRAESLIRSGMPWQQACDVVCPGPEGAA